MADLPAFGNKMGELPSQPVTIDGETLHINLAMLPAGTIYPFSDGETQIFVTFASPTNLEIYIPNLTSRSGKIPFPFR